MPVAAKMLAFATSTSSELLHHRPMEFPGNTEGSTEIVRPSAVKVEGEPLTKTPTVSETELEVSTSTTQSIATVLHPPVWPMQ